MSPIHAWNLVAGDRVLLPPGCGQPLAFIEALGSSLAASSGIELVSGILSGGYEFLVQSGDQVRLTTWQLTPAAQPAYRAGRIRLMPSRYAQLPRLFGPEGVYPVDAIVIHVAPPDADGTCSLGVSPSYCSPLSGRVPKVIAVVNPQMPDVGGHPRFHLDDAAAVVELDDQLVEFTSSAISDVDAVIARTVAGLISDGATIQTGLGAVPEALLTMLDGKKDIGLYGMLTDAGMTAIRSGVATGAAYAPAPNCFEVGEIMGSRALYDFVDHNKQVLGVSCEYAFAQETFRRMQSFVAVNSAVEVDLTGQVNAESIGHRALSGPGGQLDYMEGAMHSPNGLAVIALRSTTREGASRIVCHLGDGAAVTTPRIAVTHVVTEHGVAQLEGRSFAERAQALIAVAAPQFRDDLARGHGERH